MVACQHPPFSHYIVFPAEGSEVMAMSDEQVAAIIFNETRSLRGENIDQARVNIAHAIINMNSLHKIPKMASTTAKVPKVELGIYNSCLSAVGTAHANLDKSVDPTSGAKHFNFRKNNSQTDFQGHSIKTSLGPFTNTYPTKDLPGSDIYANTYD